ncbi:MAG: PorV/PorQ family protein [Bacteroidetes bacterium]|nr:PorV/PorQ family protein [Bacteroidota bacterium]
MMKKPSIVLMSLMLASSLLFPQSKTGTSIGAFLSIEPSSRITGMGNAGVTLYNEPQSVYYNPGSMGFMQRSAVQFTHSNWLAGITYDYGVAMLGLDDIGTVYATVTSLNSGEIDVRTVDQPLGTGERYTVSDVAVGVGIGRQISERFAVGVQVNYIQETIWHSEMTAFSFSVGTIYRLSPDGMHLGASISNFGTRGSFDGRDLRVLYDQDHAKFGDNGTLPAQLYTGDFPLPVMFRVGLGLPVQINDANQLTVAVDAYHPSDNTESLSFGAEYLFDRMIALRAGYQNLFLEDSEVGLTLGAGIQYEMSGYQFNFDYGWADHGRLTESHRITVGLTL